MKTLRLVAFSMAFVALLGVSAMAQTANANAKIALIDTQSFYAKQGGITKIANAYNRLNAELKPDVDKYNAKVNEFTTLKKSYDTLLDNAQKNIPVDEKDLQTKRDQLTNMQTDIKRLQEDLKAKQDKRQAEILGPIIREIGSSIGDFAKQKGYTFVFDIGVMANSQMLLWADQTTDITKEFITFYNAKPAGTASR